MELSLFQLFYQAITAFAPTSPMKNWAGSTLSQEQIRPSTHASDPNKSISGFAISGSGLESDELRDILDRAELRKRLLFEVMQGINDID